MNPHRGLHYDLNHPHLNLHHRADPHHDINHVSDDLHHDDHLHHDGSEMLHDPNDVHHPEHAGEIAENELHTNALHLKRHHYSSKPKIWSLADTAACKTPPPPPSTDNNGNGAGVWLAGGTTFPLPPTIPPTIPSSQAHQYPRFSHLMPGAIPSQYMANSYR